MSDILPFSVCTSPSINPVNNTYNLPITVWQIPDFLPPSPCSATALNILKPIVISYKERSGATGTFDCTVKYIVKGTIESPETQAIATVVSGSGVGTLSNLSYLLPHVPNVTFGLDGAFNVIIDDTTKPAYFT